MGDTHEPVAESECESADKLYLLQGPETKVILSQWGRLKPWCKEA